MAFHLLREVATMSDVEQSHAKFRKKQSKLKLWPTRRLWLIALPNLVQIEFKSEARCQGFLVMPILWVLEKRSLQCYVHAFNLTNRIDHISEKYD